MALPAGESRIGSTPLAAHVLQGRHRTHLRIALSGLLVVEPEQVQKVVRSLLVRSRGGHVGGRVGRADDVGGVNGIRRLRGGREDWGRDRRLLGVSPDGALLRGPLV